MRPSNTMWCRLGWVSLVLMLVTATQAQRPEITLSGTGWWQDRALRRALSELDVNVDFARDHREPSRGCRVFRDVIGGRGGLPAA